MSALMAQIVESDPRVSDKGSGVEDVRNSSQVKKKQGLIMQKEVKHGEIRFPCDQCEFTTTRSSSLKQHKEAIHEGIRYPCEYCGYAATQKSSLNRHMKSKKHSLGYLSLINKYKGTIENKQRIVYPCDTSDNAAPKVSSVQEQRESKCLIFKYRCDQCQYVAIKESALMNHKSLKHNQIRDLCDSCDFAASNPETLKRHKESIHRPRLGYHCDQREYISHEVSSSMSHRRSKTDLIIFQCDLCDYTAYNLLTLQRHKETIHPGLPCDQCDCSFMHLYSLQIHIEREHRNEASITKSSRYAVLSSIKYQVCTYIYTLTIKELNYLLPRVHYQHIIDYIV